jgi:hypothetical protein
MRNAARATYEARFGIVGAAADLEAVLIDAVARMAA